MLEKNILFMQSLFMLLKVIHLVVQKTWAAKIYVSMLSTLRRSIIVKSMCRNFSNSFLLLLRFLIITKKLIACKIAPLKSQRYQEKTRNYYHESK